METGSCLTGWANCIIIFIRILQLWNVEAEMAQTQVSIGRVKRDISDLVNRVAYGGERIVLTSRGRPKAAIVSIEDYEQLEEARARATLEQWRLWVAESDALADKILHRRGGEQLDVDALWDAARDDLEARDAQVIGG